MTFSPSSLAVTTNMADITPSGKYCPTVRNSEDFLVWIYRAKEIINGKIWLQVPQGNFFTVMLGIPHAKQNTVRTKAWRSYSVLKPVRESLLVCQLQLILGDELFELQTRLRNIPIAFKWIGIIKCARF